nr:family 10 glycosylhydrolase [Micromonospora sp. DSM 115978]
MNTHRFGSAALAVALLLTAAPVVAPPAAALAAAACAVDPAVPKRQFRAMWIASVVNIDWPSRASLTAPDRIAVQQAEYRAWLDLARQRNHNAVIVQVRPTADAFWPSPYEPWSEYLTGVRGQHPGWDPLAFLVAAAHERGLEFHAWFNPYRASMPGGAGPNLNLLAPGHPLRLNPEWAVAYPVGDAASRLYYNPGVPAARQYVQNAIMDAVTRYDIDGVHFDDYFYPYPAAGQDFPDQTTFAQYGAGFGSRAEWRRHNVDLLIRELGARIKAAKPWVKFGVSPFGIWRNRSADPLGSATTGLQSYDANHADTRSWVRNQWIDYVVPQVYWHIGFAAADYAVLVPWWSQVVAGTRVQLYIGQADYKIGDPAQPAAWQDPDEMSRHLTLNRGYPQVAGNVHFSAVQVRANRLGAVDRYAAAHYSRPALVPVMPHLPAQLLLMPTSFRVARQAEGISLTWNRPLPPSTAPAGYAVYRRDGVRPPGGCAYADARYLVGTVAGTATGGSYLDRTALPGRRYTYQVTGLDRLANEGPPTPARPVR